MFLGDGIVEDEEERDERVHHQKLGLQRIPGVCQFSMPDTAGTSPDSVCNYTDTRSSQPNQAGHTPDFPYPFVSSSSISSPSPISLVLMLNSTIIGEHNVKSSLSISPCHDHELTLSTAYGEYSIRRVQHIQSTAYTISLLHTST